ncbi:hypothetical protein YC2023_107145 [Brassica napus]
MMMGKEDLGLSLSLGVSQHNNPSSSISNNLHRFPWNQTFASTPDLGKIDVNSLPSTVDCEEEAGVSSPNSTISSTISGGKRSEREGISDHDEITPDREAEGSSGQEIEHDRKTSGSVVSEQKSKQTEVDCEYLKRCVEKLTEENRRLQKEAMELRTLKLSPQFYGQMTPPTTLIMCPSCERVAGPSSNHHQTHRPVAINPWVARAGQVAHGLDFEALRPRS